VENHLLRRDLGLPDTLFGSLIFIKTFEGPVEMLGMSLIEDFDHYNLVFFERKLIPPKEFVDLLNPYYKDLLVYAVFHHLSNGGSKHFTSASLELGKLNVRLLKEYFLYEGKELSEWYESILSDNVGTRSLTRSLQNPIMARYLNEQFSESVMGT